MMLVGQVNLTLQSYILVRVIIFGGFPLNVLDLSCSQLMALVAPSVRCVWSGRFCPFLSLLTQLLGITEKAKQA